MTSFNMSTAVELTKRLYPDGLEEILYKKVPTYGVLSKWKNFTNEGKFLVWKYATGGGASSVFANAQANKGASSFKRPFIQRSKEYALASMDGEFLDATSGNPEAIAEGFKVAMDDALYNVSRAVGFNMFRNGGGARAQLAASGAITTTTVSNDTLTLTSDSSMQGIEKGMWLNAAATDGTSGSVLSGKVQVLAVDRVAKTIQVTTDVTVSIPTIGNSYYLFRDGDFGNVMKGFQAWVPDSAPTVGDSFFGIDRSSDPTRLGGLRYAPTSGTIQEILVAASALAYDHGAEPDLVVLNPLDMANLINQVGSKATIPVKTDKPNIGYSGVELYGAAGRMTIMSDPSCQRHKAWMLTSDTWEIWCLGEVPRVLNRDGQETLREANADADELRVGGYLQMVCFNPRDNVNITLPSVGG
ncbi:MAG: hypothetical protein KGL39_47470 [Patescibacteria group bacterium]|nr:hypothetical protein [Patescibacteria group bacterium]